MIINNFNITGHAIERFLSRVVGQPLTSTTILKAREIIRRSITDKELRVIEQRGSMIKIGFKNAVFIYCTISNTIITVYQNPCFKKEIRWPVKRAA